MRYLLIFIFLFPALLFAQKEKRKVFTTTPTYSEIISTYAELVKGSKIAQFKEAGTTDIGKPLHLLILSKNGKFGPADASGKTIIMINNGIHPGEPDGIDASIELTKNFIAHPELLPDNIVLLIIPVYNVDGCLNRSSTSRANQNGPEEYGFRANSKNLDLNRDFIKCDALNTLSLEKIFREWDPDVFIDTHVSDGADYQYVMTLIETQRSKMNRIVSGFMDTQMVPALYASMKKKNYEMCPYVESYGETPETGIIGFLETPRFSTGYASLFNCISFVTETHMWKPYNDRVWATYDFLFSVIDYCKMRGAEIKKTHLVANDSVKQQVWFPLNWELDTTHYVWISFKGFAAKHKLSSVSGLERLYYDRSAPYTKQVKYFNTYVSYDSLIAPVYYIIPQAYVKVIERFETNKVLMKRFTKDTDLYVEAYYIDSYETGKSSYESHYLHYNVHASSGTTWNRKPIRYYAGDYVVPVNQACNRYIVETLEPGGGDSFFAWNFFDGILQQKEWFSDYIFEEKADSLVRADPALKGALTEKQKTDTAFAKDHWAQLYFIYQRSPYMERTYNRYPVTRINQPMELPAK